MVKYVCIINSSNGTYSIRQLAIPILSGWMLHTFYLYWWQLLKVFSRNVDTFYLYWWQLLKVFSQNVDKLKIVCYSTYLFSMDVMEASDRNCSLWLFPENLRLWRQFVGSITMKKFDRKTPAQILAIFNGNHLNVANQETQTNRQQYAISSILKYPNAKCKASWHHAFMMSSCSNLNVIWHFTPFWPFY